MPKAHAGYDVRRQVETGVDAPAHRQPPIYTCQKSPEELDYHLHGFYNQCRDAIPANTGRPRAATCTPDVLMFWDALFVCARAAAPETPEAA